jgi:hypothetical protein
MNVMNVMNCDISKTPPKNVRHNKTQRFQNVWASSFSLRSHGGVSVTSWGISSRHLLACQYYSYHGHHWSLVIHFPWMTSDMSSYPHDLGYHQILHKEKHMIFRWCNGLPSMTSVPAGNKKKTPGRNPSSEVDSSQSCVSWYTGFKRNRIDIFSKAWIYLS